MNENEIPTRVEIQEVIDKSLTKDAVLAFLTFLPVETQNKIISDLESYPGWDGLVES